MPLCGRSSRIAELEMATIAEPLARPQDAIDPGVVKVVSDRDGFALYFSRSPIPWPRDEVAKRGSIENALASSHAAGSLFLKHTGLYAYRRSFLLQFAKLAPTPLEITESLEQLRALEHGHRIKVIRVSTTSIGVDTPEDLDRVRRLIKEDVVQVTELAIISFGARRPVAALAPSAPAR